MSTIPPGADHGPSPDESASPEIDDSNDDTGNGRGPWPAPNEWPDPESSALEHAVFYRDRLGLDVYPTPSDADVAALARHEFDKMLDSWRGDHGEDAPDEGTRALLWDDAREYAEGSRRGPCGWAIDRRRKVEIFDIDFRAMWTNSTKAKRGSPMAHAAERGVCVALGRSSMGWHLAQVDNDTKHGADLAGEFAVGLPGPADRSPSGGLHVYVLAGVGDARVYASQNALAPGVEVRTSGFAVLPAGQGGDPARRWLRVDEPRLAPDALRRPPPRPSRHQTGQGGGQCAGRDPGAHAGPASGRGVATLAEPVEDSERNQKAPIVVGLLARPRALPPDVVSAILNCLVEARVGADAPAAGVGEEAAEWQAALTRGPRDERFAAEVVEAWLTARYVGRKPWRRGEIVRTVRSLWQTAARRQAERDDTVAGAEDFSVGDPIWCEDRDGPPRTPPQRAPSSPPLVPLDEQEGEQQEVHVKRKEHGVSVAPKQDTVAATALADYPFAPPAAAVATTRAPRGAGGGDGEPTVDYERLFRSFYDAYPEDRELADELTKPVSFAVGPPLYGFLTGAGPLGLGDESYPYGYGLGPWLAKALPGLRPGQVTAWGAASAKGGKTFTVGFLLEGLILATARRLLGEPTYADAPHVLVFWLTEMPEEGELQRRFQARHFGFPLSAISEGVNAVNVVESVGGMDPAEVVARARFLRSLHRREAFDGADWRKHGGDQAWLEGSFHAAHRLATRELLREIDFTALPAADGRGANRRVHDAGPRLVEHVAHAMRCRRDAYCAKYGVRPEDVLLIAAWDPGQRFVDDAAPGKQALDSLLDALRKRLASPERVAPDGTRRGGVGACVIITSDTTKSAAKEMSVGRFCHDSPALLTAEIFAGSNLISHVANTVAIFAEPCPDGRTSLMRIRPLLVRSPTAVSGVYPFTWEFATGRLRALDPSTVPLPPKPLPRDQGGSWRPRDDVGRPRPEPIGAPGDGGRVGGRGGGGGGSGVPRPYRGGSWDRRDPGDRD